MKPNLFNWATSELSQDAFLCWFLEWSKPEYTGNLLNEISLKFIKELSGIDKELINEIEIRKQHKNIDILVIINKVYAILIEDKVYSRNHSNQLVRYSEQLKDEFDEQNISLIYLKTGDQSNFSNIKSKGYKIYERKDLLSLLKLGKEIGVSNEIFLDFLDYLNKLEKSVNSYQSLPVHKWHWDSWKGFYKDLYKRLGQGDWSYVSQKNGGFLGFWWCVNCLEYKNTKFDFYLQLEQEKFCFKISPYNIKYNYEIREHYRTILFKMLRKHGIEIKKNGRCIVGKTKTMTTAKLVNSYIISDLNNIIDMDKTVYKLKQIEQAMTEIKLEYSLSHNTEG